MLFAKNSFKSSGCSTFVVPAVTSLPFQDQVITAPSTVIIMNLNYCSRKERIRRSGRHKHRVPTEWQRQLSSVHSIMMEKLAQAFEGGGVHATPFRYTVFTITYKVKLWCTLQLRGQIQSPYFISTPMYSVVIILHYQAVPRPVDRSICSHNQEINRKNIYVLMAAPSAILTAKLI